ncbi:meiotic cell cortex C-terminal pleckstrin homology-domain-containing protein [Tuber borchii]|uniref:Meiotic cell cortex C-terminal pleckstrin homology-domain-containing protein n=1 Tax=Tuber borchii TaxID=42251 RepID=A0A2T7A6Q7_TUBBO|nr:meiotic cell cortex C-terminal pleckstrin homology-domain-containing protein [Tuber borchii]
MDERFLSGGALSEMDLDDTDYATEAPLPSPAGTPYRTPLLSRHTSRHATPSPSPSPSPYPLSSSPPTTNGRASPHHRMSMSHHHDTFDDTISILDPRRFTPTLHANLVAEILSLRRELESKTSLIDTLELDLSAARSEHETATTSAATAQREARDVKRQLARVENDGAVEAVAKERDEAVETIAELKRQVERHSKARRSAEEDLESVKASAERDREKWEDLKRAQERRAHVAEGRLKALLDELSAANAMPPPPLSQSEPENEDTAPSEVAMSDTASIRTSIQGRPSSLTMSDDVAERLGIRFSMLSGNQGLSLADELDLDDVEGEDEEYEGHEEEDDDDGNRTETEAEATGDNDSGSDSGSETEDEGDLQPIPKYCEMGVQVEEEEESDEEMERPEVALLEETRAELERAYFELDQKSSELENTRIELDKAQERIGELEEQVDGLAEEVAEKKRALADKELDHEHKIKVFETRSREVEERWASIESKESTLEKMEKSLDERATNLDRREKMLDNQEAIVTPIPDSPIEKELPLLPLDDDRVSAENDSPTRPPPVIYQTIGTQTDPMKPPALQIIPTIAVTPPPPTPPLPGRPRVPMRNAAVQTRNRQRTRGMQTDEPPFEDRIMKLPARLMPAAILANNNPVLPVAPSTQPERPPSPPKKSSKRNIKRIPAMAAVPTSAPAPTSVPRSVPDSPGPPGTALIYSSPKAPSEFGETPEKDKDSVRRHLFNGVDLSHDLPQSSGDDDFHDDADLSSNEFKTALSAPRPKKRDRISSLGRPSPIIGNPDGTVYEAYKKPTNIRRSAMVSNGVHAHQRPRSPSLTSNRTSESGGPKIGPPFPVPIRHSSRKVGGYASFRAESPTPMSVGLPRRALPPRRPERQQSIRKVRSAAALSTLQTSNSRTRSPPPLSASSAAPDSPILPPLPRDEVLSHTFDKQKIGSSKHKHQASTNTSNTGNASIGSSIQQISVVDAIAQTMVGEWMWKYVRRRRSFGVPDSPQAWDGRDESTTGGGQRHKRWVWLAPYERAVMWSSRQPTSGNALLGKSGRKLPIQSVLDVKDDTPLPKGVNPAQPLFNRSILILTPARALKFTAPNKERHYVWLTALSFLSHSAHESEGLLALPPPLPFEYDQMQQQRPQSPPLTRPPIPPVPVNRDPPFNPIRDSIRVAKGKGRSKTSKSEANGYAGSGSSLGRNQRRDIDRHGRIITADTIAEPPSIPRFPGHSRKRSNTTRSSTNRSISHGYNPSLHSSFGGSSNGDYYPPGPMGVGGIGLISRNSSLNHGAPGPSLGGWESGPIGTVRMEAFIDPKPKFEFDEEDEFLGNKPSSYRLRRDRRSSRQESYWSGSGDFYAGGSEAGKGSVISGSIDDEFFRGGDDPFRGF